MAAEHEGDGDSETLFSDGSDNGEECNHFLTQFTYRRQEHSQRYEQQCARGQQKGMNCEIQTGLRVPSQSDRMGKEFQVTSGPCRKSVFNDCCRQLLIISNYAIVQTATFLATFFFLFPRSGTKEYQWLTAAFSCAFAVVLVTKNFWSRSRENLHTAFLVDICTFHIAQQLSPSSTSDTGMAADLLLIRTTFNWTLWTRLVWKCYLISYVFLCLIDIPLLLKQMSECSNACARKSQNNREKMKSPSSTPLRILNPFYNRVELSAWDMIKLVICLPIILVRAVLMLLTLISALLISYIGMFGMSIEESQHHRLPRWRRAFVWIIANIVLRIFIFCSGFVWSIKGTEKLATPTEAPIFVVGPHSSYFDAFAVILLGAPSIVSKTESKDTPIIGRLISFTQAIYVSRESRDSRKQTLEAIKQRAQNVYHGNGMPQMLIFPEGTVSNRSSLIKFKSGAFFPQVPVQPVVIRYPNCFDCCTWTFDGPSDWFIMWCALSQFYNKIEIEYLPVYTPNTAEKQDSKLFADNVRKIMAKALNVPISDYQFEDGKLLCAMRKNLVEKLGHIYQAKRALSLSGSYKESNTILETTSFPFGTNYNYKMGFHDFQREFFHVWSDDTIVPQIYAAFNCFKNYEEEKEVDIREYLVLTCILYEDKNALSIENIPRKLCQMYGLNDSEITAAEIGHLLEELFKLSPVCKAGKRIQTVRAYSSYEQKISRMLEFAKLFADEVAERLPTTYPSRAERDKTRHLEKFNLD